MISLTRPKSGSGATPKMYSDDDPLLAQVREVFLTLPETAEVAEGSELAESSYRQVALKRMLTALDGED